MLSFQPLPFESCITLSSRSIIVYFLFSGYLDNFRLLTSIHFKRFKKKGKTLLFSLSLPSKLKHV